MIGSVKSKTFRPNLTSGFGFSINTYGKVKKIKVAVGDEVKKGKVLMNITYQNGTTKKLKAPYNGVIVDIPVKVGDKVKADGEFLTIMSKQGFNIELSVDEMDITAVKLKQEVLVSIEAVDQTYNGIVNNISYQGDTNGNVTTYRVIAKMPFSEGLYPGMNANADIIVSSSGEGLLVPVQAVVPAGDDYYIYLAPAQSEFAREYQAAELDLSKLTKIRVKPGMSDGTNIMIDSQELKANDLIIVIKLNSTLTGNNRSSQSGINRGFVIEGERRGPNPDSRMRNPEEGR